MRAAFSFGVPTFALVPADNVFSATLVSFAAAMGSFGLPFDDFLVGVLDGFLGAFFAAVFFTAFLAFFLAAFFTDFSAFFTGRLPVLARVFDAAALAVRALGDLRAFFAPRFLAVFFLAVATTISFIAQTRLSGIIAGGAFTALLPQAGRTPRKPTVFARGYIRRCRARRG